MEISDGSENLSSEINTDGSYESSDSSVAKNRVVMLESWNIMAKN